jgi:hypothetical protein
MTQEAFRRSKIDNKKITVSTYNEYNDLEGRKYTCMKVGRRHKLHYDKGEWREKDYTGPMDFTFSVDKKRAGQTPEGSGVPVGIEYHWYLFAHQNVKKIDANRYKTDMTGIKYKLAHKRIEQGNWNITECAQKKRLIQIIERFTAQLKLGNLRRLGQMI